nr:conotoxin precursor J [Conus ebraeus]UMA82764.1 conotoxin precursor J [Conus ebraeus]UMA83424.1 conotoxin precursor J [Conus judaeus]UMA83744.1 conotoxin precursor J [Conus judaeus]DAZ86423.1 TPA_inf: conotoxin precursor J [Conus judaeus]
MASVQSVTGFCCLLWLMISVQLVTSGLTGTARLSKHLTARIPSEANMEILCPEWCNEGYDGYGCTCTKRQDVVSSPIRRRKRSMRV